MIPTINLNDIVRIKLSPLGREIYKEYWISAFAGFPSIFDFKPKNEDMDGWSEWQLWDLIAVFGNHVYMGCVPVFETEIQIPYSAAINQAVIDHNKECQKVCDPVGNNIGITSDYDMAKYDCADRIKAICPVSF